MEKEHEHHWADDDILLEDLERYFPKEIDSELANRLVSSTEVQLVTAAAQLMREEADIVTTLDGLYESGIISYTRNEQIRLVCSVYGTIPYSLINADEFLRTGRPSSRRYLEIQNEIKRGEPVPERVMQLFEALSISLEELRDMPEELAEEYLAHMRDLQFLQQDPTGFLLVDKAMERMMSKRDKRSTREFNVWQLNLLGYRMAAQRYKQLYSFITSNKSR